MGHYHTIRSGVLFVLLFALTLILAGCDRFEYSPFDTGIDVPREGLTIRSINHLAGLTPASPDSFAFAFLTDTHAHYDAFLDAVRSINRNPDILFVVHGGDLTDFGLRREFEWAVDIIEQFRAPVFTLIGNHDCLSHGRYIYRSLLGETQYSFAVRLRRDGFIRFVMLDDNTLESVTRESTADTWEASFAGPAANDSACHGTIVAAHVPPFNSLYFDDALENFFRSLLASEGVILSLHGHEHFSTFGEHYDDGVPYLVGGTIRNRVYSLITVYTGERTSINVTRISY